MADQPGVGAAVNELAAIPFGTLIGGPLTAAVEAQAHAAMTTVDFITTVGFDKDKNIKNVTFKFLGGSKDQNGKLQVNVLEVPLLSIVPIPFLRIENMDIHFKASLSQSMESKQAEATTTTGNINTEAGGGWLCFKAKMNASVSSKKDSSSTRDSRYSVEYTMDINVHAVQDDIPAGLSKVLGLLNESVERQMQAPLTVAPATNGNGNTAAAQTVETPKLDRKQSS